MRSTPAYYFCKWIGPSALFAKMVLFWAARNATKNGAVLGRPGIRFAAPKIITKEAKISRKLEEEKKKA
jgi:hypothetical protein